MGSVKFARGSTAIATRNQIDVLAKLAAYFAQTKNGSKRVLSHDETDKLPIIRDVAE